MGLFDNLRYDIDWKLKDKESKRRLDELTKTFDKIEWNDGGSLSSFIGIQKADIKHQRLFSVVIKGLVVHGRINHIFYPRDKSDPSSKDVKYFTFIAAVDIGTGNHSWPSGLGYDRNASPVRFGFEFDTFEVFGGSFHSNYIFKIDKDYPDSIADDPKAAKDAMEDFLMACTITISENEETILSLKPQKT